MAGGRIQVGALCAGGSYLAVSQPRVTFGLGTAKAVSRVDVIWPWGSSESWTKPVPSPGGLLRLKQGSGRAGAS
jgi:hypothetical protein